MTSSAYHLNLLMAREQVSSSPVRFRVMLPIMAILACVGLIVWWGVLAGQLFLAQSSLKMVNKELEERKQAHQGILAKTARIHELTAELAQLNLYSNSIVRRGGMLTTLAEHVPIKLQLVSLELPPPAAPQLIQRGTTFLGPTGYVERATLVLNGRATKETPILSLMESLASDAFTNDVIIVKDPRSTDPSPQIRSFRQDETRSNSGARLMAFDIVYRLNERRFGK